LENAAQRREISSAELIRDYIKRLPTPEIDNSSTTPLPYQPNG
jgi:hypothetical protein